MGQSRFLLVYFRPFLLTISIIQIGYCVWDSNPGLPERRRRRNHGAMAEKLRVYKARNMFNKLSRPKAV